MFVLTSVYCKLFDSYEKNGIIKNDICSLINVVLADQGNFVNNSNLGLLTVFINDP